MCSEILWDVSYVELSFGLVVVGEVRLLLLTAIAREDFLCAHPLTLHVTVTLVRQSVSGWGQLLFIRLGRWTLVSKPARKVTFLVTHTDLPASKPMVN